MTSTHVAAAARATGASPGTSTGVTLWLTGLPSAGKSSLASALAAVIRDRGGVRLSRLAKMKTAAAAIRKAHKNKRQSQTRIINQDDRP